MKMPEELKSKAELAAIAEKVVESVRKENLLIWQAKEVLTRAMKLIEWELFK